MDVLLNLSVSSLQYQRNEFDEWEGEDEDDGDGEDNELLYFFTRLYDLLSGNIFFTTYVERGRSEYFAGFSNVQLLAPFQDDRRTERYRWIHLSLFFRAFRSTTLS
ncbi:uncharacterized protein [Drosophila takahashii]|uniref:uncharacterized protein n=1 Tax=Drosophila takahashii TaxID=29030 RepID=UPI001CF8A2A7|nr:uncharacterized protein LOC108061796 [Drosophila takahashii]